MFKILGNIYGNLVDMWHLQLLLMNSFSKSRLLFSSCMLFFLRNFTFYQINYTMTV